MTTYSWIIVLVLLFFGIGWTSAELATPGVGAPTHSSDDGRDGLGHKGSRGRRCGPFLNSVEQFAVQLGLSDAQRDRMDAIFAATMEEVRGHEKAIWEAKLKTRPQILSVLTDAQRRTLDELVQAERLRWIESNVERRMDWFMEQEFPAATLAAVHAVFESYEREKSEFFHQLADSETLPAEGFVEQSMDDLKEVRDARLLELIGADEMEQYSSAGSNRRSSHR